MDLFYQSITVELISDKDTGYITYSHLDLAKLVIEEQKVNSREEKKIYILKEKYYVFNL